jgi:lysozyme
MKISHEGLKVKKYFEQCKLEAYPDPGSKDGHPWTIGWGHTGKEVVKGLKWTQEKADSTLVSDSAEFSNGVSSLIKVFVNQNQFDAIASLAYNIGLSALKSSTLLRKLNEKDYQGAMEEFPKWDKNDGKVMLGLRRRRTAEKLLFQGFSADDAIEEAKKVK